MGERERQRTERDEGRERDRGQRETKGERETEDRERERGDREVLKRRTDKCGVFLVVLS